MEIRVFTNKLISSTLKVPVQRLVNELIEVLNLKVLYINVIFTSDSELKQMHKTYLNENSVTDVITFNLNDNGSVEGEIYISAQRAAIQAKMYHVSFNQEICRLVIHGCLHLAGYSDAKKSDQRVMKHEEDKLTEAMFNLFEYKNI